ELVKSGDWIEHGLRVGVRNAIPLKASHGVVRSGNHHPFVGLYLERLSARSGQANFTAGGTSCNARTSRKGLQRASDTPLFLKIKVIEVVRPLVDHHDGE